MLPTSVGKRLFTFRIIHHIIERMTHETKKAGRRPIDMPVLTRIANMGKGEVVVKRKEWRLVEPPGAHILRRKLGQEYVVKSLADDSGWVVKKA